MLTLGADPEIFVKKGSKISHCIGKLGGTKEEPIKVSGGALQEDNVLFEFNIDPCSKYEDFSSRITNVIIQGLTVLGPDFSLSNKSSHIYTDSELAEFPESAFVFGCDPDYNALTGKMNPRPKAERGLRTAGGHVHFGVKDLLLSEGTVMDEGVQRELIVLSDYYLGLPSLLLDGDDMRRQLYGQAGAMRFKEYGAEYRTLSNFWIHEESNKRWVWDQAQKVVANLKNLRELISIAPPAVVQDIINRSDRRSAESLMKKLQVA